MKIIQKHIQFKFFVNIYKIWELTLFNLGLKVIKVLKFLIKKQTNKPTLMSYAHPIRSVTSSFQAMWGGPTSLLMTSSHVITSFCDVISGLVMVVLSDAPLYVVEASLMVPWRGMCWMRRFCFVSYNLTPCDWLTM